MLDKLLKIMFFSLLVNWINYSNAEIVKIGIEGIPGAGKTSALLALTPRLSSKCIVLSEINPDSDSDWDTMDTNLLFKNFHEKWFARINAMNLFNKSKTCFVSDRTFYSNLSYLYALDAIKDSNYYESQLHLHKQDFSHTSFNHIIILLSKPNTSMLRRNKLNKPPSELKKEELFLEKFQEFYIKELPKLSNSHYTIINTDKLSHDEVQSIIVSIIESYVGTTKINNNFFDKKDIIKIKKFAQAKNLKGRSSEPVLVQGVPTIYYEKNSVQLRDKIPVLFDDKQLVFLSKFNNGSN